MFPNKERIIVSAVVSLVLTLVMLWGYQIENNGRITLNAAVLPGFVISMLSVLLIYKLADMFRDRFHESVYLNRYLDVILDSPVRSFAVIAVLLFFLYFVQFLGVYPGLFIFDAGWQLQMYDWGMISEHHPVLHTVLIGWLVNRLKTQDGSIEYGVAAYVILQMIIFVCAESYLLTYIYGKLKNAILLFAGVLYFGLHPTIVLHVMSVTKDSLFAAFFILVLPLTIELIRNSTLFVRSRAKITAWCICVTLIVILRNNCVYAIPVLIIGVLVCSENKRIALMLTGISLVLFVLYKTVFVPMYVTEPVDGREMLSVPSNQLAALYNSDEAKLSEDDREFIKTLINEDGLKNYNPRIADKVKAGLDMDYCRSDLGEVKDAYLHIIRNNAGLAFNEFLVLTEGFWYPFYRDYQITYKDRAYWIIDCYEPAVISPKINPIYNYFRKFEDAGFVTQNAFVMLLLSPGTYFCFIVLMLGYAVIRKAREYISIFLFVLIFWLTYLLGPVALVRYTGYLYVMVPVYALLILEKENTIIDG